MSRTKSTAIVILVLLVFGLVRWPLETNLTDECRSAGIRTATLNLALRQKISQDAFMAALSGFRSLVATFYWLEMTDAWAETDWAKIIATVNLVTMLQPRDTRFWDEGAWQMAWNAANNIQSNTKLRAAQRSAGYLEYIHEGEDILKRGIANNPEKWQLYFALGNLYRDRLQDYCSAAEQYRLAAERPGVPEYIKRFESYMLAQCPGHEKESYEKLKTLYNLGPKERTGTVVRLIKELEEKLAIPVEQRIYKPE